MKKNLILFLFAFGAKLHAVQPTLNWTVQLSEGNHYKWRDHLSSPVVDEDGTMYLMIDGKVNALNTVDGSIIWTNNEINASRINSQSGNNKLEQNSPMLMGDDNLLYTISEIPTRNRPLVYLVSLSKVDGLVTDKILINSIVGDSGYYSLGYHNNNIFIDSSIFSSYNGELRLINKYSNWQNMNISGYTDKYIYFEADGHLYAANRATGLTEWVYHLAGNQSYTVVDERGNLFVVSSLRLISLDGETGAVNFSVNFDYDKNFFATFDDSSLPDSFSYPYHISSIYNSSNDYIAYKSFIANSDVEHQEYIFLIDKNNGSLISKNKFSFRVIDCFFNSDGEFFVVHEEGIYIYNTVADFSNYVISSSIPFTFTYPKIYHEDKIFMINDTNLTSWTIPSLSYREALSFPDTSTKYEAGSTSANDTNESISVRTHTPQNTDSSNSGSSSGSTDTSNGGSSDYSSDPNYIADFIATNALDYGYAPLVELTSTGATPHTDGWYYQPTWGWMWTSEEIFPYVFRSESEGKTAGWMYFKEGSGSPIYFYSYSDQKWTLLEESTD